MKKLLSFVLSISVLMAFCSCNKPQYYVENYFEESHMWDTKIYDENTLVTGIDGMLAFVRDGVSYITDVHANWIDAIPEEGIGIYGNGFNEIGIFEVNNIETCDVFCYTILNSDNLLIDPTIINVNGTYYITVTEIEGVVNNGDPDGENGHYTIHLYSSSDLKNWNFITDIDERDNNLEDLFIWQEDGDLFVLYEIESCNLMPSQIVMSRTYNGDMTSWSEPVQVIEPDSDHELAACLRTSDGYRIYYSCDVNNLGQSYQAGEVFYRDYDENFSQTDEHMIDFSEFYDGGLLLYDVNEEENIFVASVDYNTVNDLIVIKR